MISSGEVLRLSRERGGKMTYGELKGVMRRLGIVFKTEVHAGFPIEGYLTSGDVRVIQDETGVQFNKGPRGGWQ